MMLSCLNAAEKSAVLSDNILESQNKAVIIPIEGMVKKLLLTTLKRRTEAAIESGVDLIIFRVKSDGGELGSAMEMSNYVFGLDSSIRTIAYVEAKAYSAAALFSLACDDLAMKPGSAIGDCEPILPGNGGYVTAGEKIQTVLKERFRTFAKTNGYPEDLSQAMVSSKLKIYRVVEKASGNINFFRSENWDILEDDEKAKFENRKIVCHQDELLTLSDSEAQDLGFSFGTFKTSDDLLEYLNYTESAEVVDVNETEEVVEFFDQISGMILVLGLFLIYMEFKTPGIGIFGALAALCFSAFFIGKFYQGQADYLEMMLFVLGIALIVLEVFVFPGFGIAGISGMLLLFASLVLAMQNFSIPETELENEIIFRNITNVALYFFYATTIFFVGMIVLSRGKSEGGFGHGLLHRKQQQISNEFKKAEHLHAEVESLIGKVGLTTTVLSPGGKAVLDNVTYSVSSCDGWIDKDKEVKVMEQEGNQLLVSNYLSNEEDKEIV